MNNSTFRRDWITKPIFRWARHVLPTLSDTEREAIEAGDVWWDADLFTGNPDWEKLLAFPKAKLSAEEQAFLAGPVEQLCHMLDDWQITWELRDLPPEVWDFLKANKFFAMIIPKAYGGLGFSAYAHSEVVRKLSTRAISGAVTAMVPNSLGPGELLHRFGTKEQQDYWLPRLAAAKEIPCFGLTSPEAGSDAASMTDTGVVCRGLWEGREVLGIRLNWHKRYITLGPIATVLGLAFKLYDPDHLLGTDTDVGITVALVPTHLPGVEIGRRHLPGMHVFQNGPNRGRDVFIPMDHVIGGVAQVGKGWKMLMSALAAGRGISLPSLSAAGAAFAAHATGAYARIREQFHISIGRFEAVQERLGRMAATAYLIDAARRLTCAALDNGHQPAVVTAIMKSQATDRMRVVANDAMDVHGGKGIQEGPLNYLGSLYRAVPIGITVEGANIVTRSLIQFGQGAIRSHPYLLAEMTALEDSDRARGLDAFDRVFWRHVGHSLGNAWRAFIRAWSGIAALAVAARRCGQSSSIGRSGATLRRLPCRRISRSSRSAAASSARRWSRPASATSSPSSICLSAVLKRWEDEGRQDADLPLVEWCMEDGLRHHRDAPRRDPRQFPQPAGGVAAALPAAAVRRAPARSVRPADAGVRGDPARALGDARPPHRRHLPCRRRQGPRPARACLRSRRRHPARTRPHAQGARARPRRGPAAASDQRGRGGRAHRRRAGGRGRGRGRRLRPRGAGAAPQRGARSDGRRDLTGLPIEHLGGTPSPAIAPPTAAE